MSASDVVAIRERLGEHGPMKALRFQGDKLCTAAKFDKIKETFNDDAERIELVQLPGNGHSVLTRDLISGGEPAEQALREVLAYFGRKLK